MKNKNDGCPVKGDGRAAEAAMLKSQAKTRHGRLDAQDFLTDNIKKEFLLRTSSGEGAGGRGCFRERWGNCFTLRLFDPVHRSLKGGIWICEE